MGKWYVFGIGLCLSCAYLCQCTNKSGFAPGPCFYQTSTWKTADDFVHTGGAYSQANAFGSDQSGNIYSAGFGNAAIVRDWVVRKSTDHGASWSMVDNFLLAGGNLSQANAFGSDGLGNLYAAGTGVDGGGVNYLMVRKSSDQGTSWATVGSLSYGTGANNVFTGFTADINGNLYAVGYGVAAATNWLVYKSSDQGASWVNMDTFLCAGGNNSQANSVIGDKFGNIYVSGVCLAGGGVVNWVVRKSADHGTTWTSVDNYIYTSGNFPVSNAVTSDSSGNIYASGYTQDGSGTNHWFVRKSTNQGSSWSSVDDFVFGGGTNSESTAIGVDLNGDIWASGFAFDSVGTKHWLARESTNQGATWTLQDNFVYTGGTNSASLGFGMDPLGNIFALGAGVDNFGTIHWVTRSLSCTN